MNDQSWPNNRPVPFPRLGQSELSPNNEWEERGHA